MRAWAVDQPGPIASRPLRAVELARPEPGVGQVLARVRACGVCRTDLHLAEGDLSSRRHLTVPGHEVVATVEALGPSCEQLTVGERVGVPWLAATCGECRFCRAGRENLCVTPLFTGWDLDGGYAEYIVAREAFVYRLPEPLGDLEAAPLLCAGIIGYRAFKRATAGAPADLGLYGFGGSAHLCLQVAVAAGVRVHVFTRSEAARRLALELGATSAQGSLDSPPAALDASIIFAPAGSLLPVALEGLGRGGTVVLAGIYMSELPPLDYERHLFYERSVTTVTANTREDGREFLALAAKIGITVTVSPYGFELADRALADLAAGKVSGAAVLELD